MREKRFQTLNNKLTQKTKKKKRTNLTKRVKKKRMRKKVMMRRQNDHAFTSKQQIWREITIYSCILQSLILLIKLYINHTLSLAT
jgi:type VI protein secretion system component VasF